MDAGLRALLDVATALLVGVPKAMALIALALVLESLRPLRQAQPLRDKAFNLLWIIHFSLVANLLMLGLARLVASGVAALGGPFLRFDFPQTPGGVALQVVVLLLFFDLFYYVLHRCQHAWPWLWAHHRLHHSEQHINATTSFRHHWMELVYRIPFILIPMGLVEFAPVPTAIAWNLAMAWSVFVHMNVRLALGPLTGWLAGPQWHRIHHSVRPQHRDRNFSAYFPLWDRVFGTFHRPARDEFPPCGPLDGEIAPTVWHAHALGFDHWWRMLRRGAASLRECVRGVIP